MTHAMDPERTVHVEPVNDLAEHVIDGARCWCQPQVEEVLGGWIVKHNALDGRASQDATTRLPS